MEITIEELQKGDEVLIPINGRFKYLKLLNSPCKNNKTGRWKATKCITKVELINKSWKRYDGSIYKYIVKKYICIPPDENDTQVYQDFSRKTAWLIKREEI